MRTSIFICLLLCLSLASLTSQAEERLRYAIAIHGGAGGNPSKWSEKMRTARMKGLERALERGQKILSEGGKSLDAVEQVIRILEDDPTFNAGKGAVLNEDGAAELDASIMNGRDRSCGAVAGAKRAKNPISLARLVMTKTRHVLLSSDGADRFAKQMKVDIVERNYFITDAQRVRWRAWKERQQAEPEEKRGTVGCVALDANGDLAAGTSTGGLIGKRFGRIGDSPIIAAGTYADNDTCAVSSTGIGEQFIRHVVAYDISARMKYKEDSLKEAVEGVFGERLKPGYGGIISVDRRGKIVMHFNTAGMSRAAADASGLKVVKLGR